MGIYSMRVALPIRISSRVKSGGGGLQSCFEGHLCALKHYRAAGSSHGPDAHDYLGGASAFSEIS